MTHLKAAHPLCDGLSPSLTAKTAMRNPQPPILLSFLALLLVWPDVHSTDVLSSTQPAPTSPASSHCEAETTADQEQSRPHMEKVMRQKCDSSVESYCLNGECLLLLDLNEHHCKCERGYYGPRCAHLEMVFQPMKEEHVILMVVCGGLLFIGVAGAFYFFCRWYKRNRCPPQQKQQTYQEVQMA
ncbi:proepiregulin isoform X1 [Salmo trutta]|uniref:EGF-like domain-containing protein n=1 Tax=Salmo trutta TaxID=8032 RepID=A0A673X3N3_SALTR|nr:proepiregulin isoform X1 [Salmo trutta]XP_029573914.1 proepiregulin isoform X1 [Salmo trutta]